MSNTLIQSPYFASLIEIEDVERATQEALQRANEELLAATGGGGPVLEEIPATVFADTNWDTNPSISIAYEMQRLLDWRVIDTFRREVAEMLTSAVEAEGFIEPEDLEVIGLARIDDVVRAHVEETVRTLGQSHAWKPSVQIAAARAVFDSLFRLGRLQPLLELPGAENIDITGHDLVYVNFSDGTQVQYDPVAGSDAEFVADIQFLASRGGEGGRSWSDASPILDMDLPGGARLAAVLNPVAGRPTVVIRIHRLVNITLDDLVNIHQTLPRSAAVFLEAAVLDGRSIVVSGFPSAGKTTLTRALANCLPKEVKIVTIEKERELHLDKLPGHNIVKALQYRPGSGERQADGSRAGEVTMIELLEESLRLDAQRIIVGEVRGGEINAMFQAMQAGVGSFSTIHSSSAANAIERMATLMLMNQEVTDDYAYRQIAGNIDIIVQITKMKVDEESPRRLITEIVEVVESDLNSRPTIRPVFELDERNHLQAVRK